MNAVSESDESNKDYFWVARPIRQPWSPFDDVARDAFLNAIRNGVRSRSMAMRLCGLSPATVNRWIALGKRDDYADEDYEYRLFYLKLLAAEAERAAIADVTLTRHARMDPKVADALKRHQERAEERRLMGPHLERKARAEADEAEYEARIAKAKAEVAERAAQKINGAVIFPPEFFEMCTPEEQGVLAKALERTRMLAAPKEVVEEALAEQETDDIEEFEEALNRHPKRELPKPAEPDDGGADELEDGEP
jgi:hypothetical protein